jgi:hypothetical protein
MIAKCCISRISNDILDEYFSSHIKIKLKTRGRYPKLKHGGEHLIISLYNEIRNLWSENLKCRTGQADSITLPLAAFTHDNRINPRLTNPQTKVTSLGSAAHLLFS